MNRASVSLAMAVSFRYLAVLAVSLRLCTKISICFLPACRSTWSEEFRPLARAPQVYRYIHISC